jgi:uncharacterized membrane protein AbrB (regulator of aidB expression)
LWDNSIVFALILSGICGGVVIILLSISVCCSACKESGMCCCGSGAVADVPTLAPEVFANIRRDAAEQK